MVKTDSFSNDNTALSDQMVFFITLFGQVHNIECVLLKSEGEQFTNRRIKYFFWAGVIHKEYQHPFL